MKPKEQNVPVVTGGDTVMVNPTDYPGSAQEIPPLAVSLRVLSKRFKLRREGPP